MNVRIAILLIVTLLSSANVQAQLLEPRPTQNIPDTIANDPSFGLLGSERDQDASEELLLRGRITSFDFVQPETQITLEANRESWQLIAPSAVELRRLGWSSNSLFAGEMVEVQAQRTLAAGNIAQVNRITRANGALLLTGLGQEESPTAFADVPEGLYTLDPRQAHLFFIFNHMGFSNTPVKVERMTGSAQWNSSSPETSEIQMDLDVSSFRSGVSVLDEALRGPDFFDFLNNPRVRFNSTGISLSKWGVLTITGQLEVMGISQPVSLDASLTQVGPNPMTQRMTVGISAKGEISRSAWGMTDYLPIIDDTVTIEFEGEFIRGDSRSITPNGIRPRQDSSENPNAPSSGFNSNQ